MKTTNLPNTGCCSLLFSSSPPKMSTIKGSKAMAGICQPVLYLILIGYFGFDLNQL